MNKTIKTLLDRMKATMIPQVDETVKVTFDGKLVVKTNTPDGKSWVTADGVIIPEDFLCDDFPVLTIAKKKADVKVGDIVKLTSSTYGIVKYISDKGEIKTTTFGGDNREAKAFKDFLFGEGTVRVVINLFANMDNATQMNPLALMALVKGDEEDNSSLEDVLLMSALSGNTTNPLGNVANNPLMLAMLLDKGESKSDLMTMMLLSQNGMNLFGTQTAPTKD